MISYHFYALFPLLATAFSNPSSTTALSKRRAEGAACYDLSKAHFTGFSALCPTSEWPIKNDKGLNVMGTFYFAMVATTLPDDTIYQAQENIICTVNGETPTITAEVSASAGYGPVKGGGSISFSFPSVNTGDNSICMFTEGSHDKSAAPNITLAQARGRLLELLNTPNLNCETCGRIRIQPDDSPTNSSDPGAILKLDVRGANNCLGNCVGPNSFSTATPSPSASKSAGIQLMPAVGWSTQAVFATAATAWLIGIGVFGIMVAQ